MTKAPHYDYKGKKLTDIALDETIFNLKANPAALAQALYVYQDNAHQHTSKVKTRGEIARTKAKWFKQKGTGRARHGARSAHIFVGGGVAFGPTGVRAALKQLPQKVRRLATALALTALLKDEKLIIVSGLDKLSGKTKDLNSLVNKIGGSKTLVLSATNAVVTKASRNISALTLVPYSATNAFQLLSHPKVLVDQDALSPLSTWLNDRKKSATVIATPKVEAKSVVKATKVATKTAVKKAVKTTVEKPAAGKAAVKKVTKVTKKSK